MTDPSVSHLYGLVLAGGTGARFWPLSRDVSPKQLLTLFGSESLIAQAVHHVGSIAGYGPGHVLIMTNERYVDELRNGLTSLGEEDLRAVRYLVEPAAEGPGPALLLALAIAEREDPHATVICLPSHYSFADDSGWAPAVRSALALPDPAVRISFTDPDDTVEGHCEAYVVRPAALLDAAARREDWREHAETVRALARDGYSPDSVAARDAFALLTGTSLDGIIAIAGEPPSVSARARLREVGSFADLGAGLPTDEAGVARLGRGVDIDSRNTTIYAPERLIATLGLSDVIIVDAHDSTLVLDASRAHEVGRVVDALRADAPDEVVFAHSSIRPWGSWTSLLRRPGLQIKTIDVKAGHRVSLQSHERRSEHWIVTSGVASVTLGDLEREVHPGESVYIPVGTIHRMENRGDALLQLVEVQVGDYLGDDDIIRHEDDYSRS